MDLEKFRAMIANEGRSKDDLLQILENCRMRPDLVAEVQRVLDQRFPPKGKGTRSRISRGSPSQSTFKGESRYFESAKDAYVWLVEPFISVRPELFQNIDSDTLYVGLGARRMKDEKRHRMRNYFAQLPEKLFRNTPELANNPSCYHRLTNGWFANLNISNVQKFEILSRLAHVSNLAHVSDWDFEILDGTDRLKAAKERARLMAEIHKEMLE